MVKLLSHETKIAVASALYTEEKFYEYFAAWYTEAIELAKLDYKRFGSPFELDFDYDDGKRYVRLTKTSCGQTSSWGFIDKTTGQVLKAASWKAPAKNFARGHIMITPKYIAWTGIQ